MSSPIAGTVAPCERKSDAARDRVCARVAHPPTRDRFPLKSSCLERPESPLAPGRRPRPVRTPRPAAPTTFVTGRSGLRAVEPDTRDAPVVERLVGHRLGRIASGRLALTLCTLRCLREADSQRRHSNTTGTFQKWDKRTTLSAMKGLSPMSRSNIRVSRWLLPS